jgi:hypothetical protein
MTRNIPGPFVEQGIVLHYQEGVVFLEDGPELDGGGGAPDYQFHGGAVQSAEDARADACDEEDLERCMWDLASRRPFFARIYIPSCNSPYWRKDPRRKRANGAGFIRIEPFWRAVARFIPM